MTRVLFCTTGYAPEARGGSERQAKLQAEELTRRGHSVTVVCHAFGHSGISLVNGVRVVRLAGARGRRVPTLTYGFALAFYLATHIRQFDIVHVHVASFHTHVAALFASIFRRPVYLKLGTGGTRGDIAMMQRRENVTRLFGLRRVSKFQAISSEIFDDLVALGISRDKVVRIPNGYDQSIFRPVDGSKEALRQKLCLPPDKAVVLYTGRFNIHKGLTDLLAVWRAAARDAVLVLIGTAPSLEYVPALTSNGDVLVRDWTEQIEDYLQAADLFVLPSYAEGMSNSLLEAMASGLAVIATRVGAAEEMIDDGRSGLLIEPGDREGLAKALDTLIQNPELRESMGRMAAATTAARYSITRVVDAIEAAYEHLVP